MALHAVDAVNILQCVPCSLHCQGWAQSAFIVLILQASNAGNSPQPAQHNKTHDERCIAPPTPLSCLPQTGALLRDGELRGHDVTCRS